jgi:lysophospholipase L1-like esterase
MGVRIQELPETTGINKEDLLIVEDGQGTKKGTVQQLDEALGVSQLKEDLIEQLTSLSVWNNKKYVSYGDSITWYDGHDYPNGELCIGYQSIMNEQIGFNLINNQGYSGYSLADGTSHGTGVVTEILKNNNTTYDLCTIACGTNDFKLNVPIGELGIIGENDFDRNTFYGAYRTAIEYLLNQKPALRIVLFTPLQRDNDGYDVNKINTAGYKLIDYVNAIKKVGELYGLPVCDMYSNSGFTKLTLDTYTIDGLHPNNNGFKRMGNYATKFVNSIGL